MMHLFHILANFPAHAVNAILLGAQATYCLITQSVPVLGGAVLRAERPGFFLITVGLMAAGFFVHLFGIHF